MKKTYIFGALFAVAVIGAVSQFNFSQAQAANLFPYTDPVAVAAGEQIYQENCASCHGANLEGEPNWRSPKPTGLMPAPPHDVTGHTWHHPDEVLFLITKYGTAAMVGNGYQSDMQGFEDILSDEEIAYALAYVKSTWPADVVERHDAMNAQAADGS